MKRPEIVVLSNKNFQFINKAHSEPTFWESLWRTYLQLTGCVFVVGCMRYGEGNHFFHQPLSFATYFLTGPVHSFYLDLFEYPFI